MRFSGFCERLCAIDISVLSAWAESIPIEEWPRTAGAMRTIEWRDARAITEPYEREIMEYFPKCSASLHYFSMLFPSASIAAHSDSQTDSWICRVHVPIVTNENAWIVIEGNSYHLPIGAAYKVNTLRSHSVVNNGLTPRIHWMFDVHVKEDVRDG